MIGVSDARRNDMGAPIGAARRHQGAVAGRMWRFTRDPRQLEELVHEVFVEAYFSLSGYRGRAPFAHWLNRVATRVGYRFWKRRRRADRAAAPLADWDTVAAEPPPPAEAGELLHRLLGQLGPRDRLVLTLIYLEGHSVAETTDLTGWSRTLVKVQAHRARKRLRALLERAGAGRENGPWTS